MDLNVHISPFLKCRYFKIKMCFLYDEAFTKKTNRMKMKMKISNTHMKARKQNTGQNREITRDTSAHFC